MPQEGDSGSKRKSLAKGRQNTDSDTSSLYINSSFRSDYDGDLPASTPASSLPPIFRAKLHDLFSQIEKEFEALYTENATLQCKVDTLTEKVDSNKAPMAVVERQEDSFDLSSKPPKHHKLGGSHKVKTAHKLKAQTSKIVSSWKGAVGSAVCSLVKEYSGHKDGIWDVAVARPGLPFIGTASADRTGCVWSMDRCRVLLRYTGHTGSVNSIKFHPTRDLVLTASGDKTAHIWHAALDHTTRQGGSSDEEICGGGGDEDPSGDCSAATLRTPAAELGGHSNVVLCADWLAGGDTVVTASWDRTACLHDAESADVIHTLTGHDQEVTYVSCHPVHKLIVTSSEDTTFRLWDFRDPIHSVSVFQGHTHTVNSAVFTKKDDKVVSGSDDRTVKVWDLRNMRSALTTIRCDSAVNRLSVSSTGIMAIPHDNRTIRLHDLTTGNRIARLSRSSRQGHHRMVTSVSWCEDVGPCSFFSSGFDRLTLGWSLQNYKEQV